MQGTKNGFVCVAPVLPLDVRMITGALAGAGCLSALFSGGCFSPSAAARLRRFSPLFARFDLAGRTSPVADIRLVHRLWRADLLRKLFSWHSGNSIRACDRAFSLVDAAAARWLARHGGAVVAREDACLQSFAVARANGDATIYHMPTAHWRTVRALMLAERELYPDLIDDADLDEEFAPERQQRKDAELAGAETVLCASSFVARTVEASGAPAANIITLPLGTDSQLPIVPSRKKPGLFLYAGQISVRKGVHRLIRAWKALGAHRTNELRLIGDMRLPDSFVKEHAALFSHQPRMPRARLIEEFRHAEAFVFNPMADGFGHVFAEAMVCGAPVLASRNCGAPDLVEDFVEGRLFEFGRQEALEAALDWALTHPGELASMGRAASARAGTWGWPQFQARFLELLGRGECRKTLAGGAIRL